MATGVAAVSFTDMKMGIACVCVSSWSARNHHFRMLTRTSSAPEKKNGRQRSLKHKNHGSLTRPGSAAAFHGPMSRTEPIPDNSLRRYDKAGQTTTFPDCCSLLLCLVDSAERCGAVGQEEALSVRLSQRLRLFSPQGQ